MRGFRLGVLLGILMVVGCGRTPEPNPLSLQDVETRLKAAASESTHLRLFSIGDVPLENAVAPIWVVSFEPNPSAPAQHCVLLSGSVHGNEPAGAGALVTFVEDLQAHPDRYTDVAFDVIPVVNPWGFAHTNRRNARRRDLNRDFASFKCPESRYVRDFAQGRTYDLIVDFHEDRHAKGFYLYQLAQDDASWSRRVIEAEKAAEYPVAQKARMAFLKAHDGVIAAPLWSLRLTQRIRQLSMTNYFRLTQCDRVFLFETPRSLPWPDRLRMHRIALDSLLEALTHD